MDIVGHRQQAASVALNDGATNKETDAHAARLRRVELFEESLRGLRIEADS